MRNPNWTAREDAIAADLLQRLLVRGEPRPVCYILIGERLGRSGDAVKRRMNWMRLSAECRAEIGRTKTRNRGAEARV